MSLRSSERRRLAALKGLEKALMGCCTAARSSSEGGIALASFVGLQRKSSPLASCCQAHTHFSAQPPSSPPHRPRASSLISSSPAGRRAELDCDRTGIHREIAARSVPHEREVQGRMWRAARPRGEPSPSPVEATRKLKDRSSSTCYFYSGHNLPSLPLTGNPRNIPSYTTCSSCFAASS
jgi:hypothetical protein